MTQTYYAYIKGEWVGAATGATTANINPANTADIVGSFPCMDEHDAIAAVEATAATFAAWRKTTPVARGEVAKAAGTLAYYGAFGRRASGEVLPDVRMDVLIMRAVEAGAVAVNLPTAGWDVQVPFGGFKDSGSPFKEHAADAVAFFSRTKAIAINPGYRVN